MSDPNSTSFTLPKVSPYCHRHYHQPLRVAEIRSRLQTRHFQKPHTSFGHLNVPTSGIELVEMWCRPVPRCGYLTPDQAQSLEVHIYMHDTFSVRDWLVETSYRVRMDDGDGGGDDQGLTGVQEERRSTPVACSTTARSQ